jgi:hypothetical protein
MDEYSKNPTQTISPTSSVRHAEPTFIPELFISPCSGTALSEIDQRDSPNLHRSIAKAAVATDPKPDCIGKFVRILGQIDVIDVASRRVMISFRDCALAVDVALLPLDEPLRVGRMMEFFGEICKDLVSLALMTYLFAPVARLGYLVFSYQGDNSDAIISNMSDDRILLSSETSPSSRDIREVSRCRYSIVLKARLCRSADEVDLLLYEKTVRIARAFMNVSISLFMSYDRVNGHLMMFLLILFRM